jgi:hypothetical protein
VKRTVSSEKTIENDSTDIHVSKKVLANCIMSDGKPITVSKSLFFRHYRKNDLADDPLQGRSLLKQANPREKPNAI